MLVHLDSIVGSGNLGLRSISEKEKDIRLYVLGACSMDTSPAICLHACINTPSRCLANGSMAAFR